MPRGGLAREFPLVGFTLLSQAAAGAFWSFAAAEALSGRRALDRRSLHVILLAGAAGTLLSLFHLGKPARAANALANLRSSWISREILADLLFLAACAALWLLAEAGAGRNTLRTALIVLGAAAGLILVYSMSRIYMLRTVPVWKSAHTPASFFLSAARLGPLVASVLTPGPAVSGSLERLIFAEIAVAAAGLILVSMALFTPSVGLLDRTQTTLLAFSKRKMAGFLAVRTILLLAAAASLAVFLLRSMDGFAEPAALIAGGAAALAAEIAGRALFYAMYSRLGV